jgi:hypothetical protein
MSVITSFNHGLSNKKICTKTHENFNRISKKKNALIYFLMHNMIQ